MFRRYLLMLASLVLITGCDDSFWGGPVSPTDNTSIVKPLENREFRLLILYDVDDLTSLPAEQRSILTSRAVRAYLKEHCAKDSSGTPEFRILDYREQLSGVWAEVVKANPIPKGSSYPWMWVTDGVSKGYTGPTGESIDRFLLTVKPYAEGE